MAVFSSLTLLLALAAGASGLSTEAHRSFAAGAAPSAYPADAARIPSPGHMTWHVDPTKGDDANAGTRADRPWKSFAKVNALRLAPGDSVVIAPGRHETSLKPLGAGTAQDPVTLRFLPGVHAFASENLYRRPYAVSNSCDKPEHPLPIALFTENARHLRFQGGGVEGAGKTTLLLAGPERATYFVNDHAEDIVFENLIFDLKHPTVSEYRVLEAAADSVLIEIAEGCAYEIKDGKFFWAGDLGGGWTMTQQAIPENGRCWRMGGWNPFTQAKAEEAGTSPAGRPLVRLTYAKGNLGMIQGRQFQFRNTERSVVTAHNTRSKNIVMRNCDIHAFTGMAIVSQFTDGITFDHVRVAPEKGTLRTCPAWADNLHFSGCRGQITITDCLFSGSQDDPINVHGTHLRIVARPTANQLQLRFMQSQTYGFAAFQPGDEVAVIASNTLREYEGNPRRVVVAIERKSDKEWLLTLDGPAPRFNPNDVLDNLSWYPDLTVKNCKVDLASCRGFLITTRGKVLVEGCTFTRCAMPALLMEDDAAGWFESGPLRDLTIRDNTFIASGIALNPEVRSGDLPVHENIRIENNRFLEGAGISAHHVKNLTITGNRSETGNIPIHLTKSCTEVKISDNARKASGGAPATN